MKRWAIYACAMAWVILRSISAEAAAWNQSDRDGLFIFGSNLTQASEFFDDDLNAVPLSEFEKTEVRAYLEYGIARKLTLVGNTAWQQISFEQEAVSFKFTGLDQTELGLQYELARREGLAASLRASYVIDGGPDTTLVDVLPGGDAIELRALLGQSRETLLGDLFYDVQIAARTRDFDRIDSLHGDWTLGYKPTHRNMVLVQGFTNYAPKDRIQDFKINPQLQVTGKLSYARQVTPGRWIQIGLERTMVGRNIVRETTLATGIWTEF